MGAAAEAFAEAAVIEHRGGFRRRWYRTPSFVAGVSILGTIVLLAALAPVVPWHSPTEQNLLTILQGPSWNHPFGTDALGLAPILVRSLRASLLEVLESEYVTTARAKGLPERRVLVRHALRNAVISTVSVLGVNIGFLVGGTLVIEQVFALPGIGQLMINSIFQRDFPVVQAVTLVFAIMVVLVYLLTDVVHALLDPRVRFD